MFDGAQFLENLPEAPRRQFGGSTRAGGVAGQAMVRLGLHRRSNMQSGKQGRQAAANGSGHRRGIFHQQRAGIQQQAAVKPARKHRNRPDLPQGRGFGVTAWQRHGKARQRARRVGTSAGERLAGDDGGGATQQGCQALAGIAQFGRLGRQHAQRRYLLQRLAIAVDAQRRFEGRQRQLVAAQGAIQRMRAALRDALGAAEQDAALRATEQLVAGESHHVGAIAQALVHARLVAKARQRGLPQQARTEVLQQQEPARAHRAGQFGQRRHAGKTLDAVVAGVHLQPGHGGGGGVGFVVAQVGFVGGTDLDHLAASSLHHFRHAEATADLDQFAARNHHFAAGAQRAEHQGGGGGVVVDNEGASGAGQLAQQGGDTELALVAFAGDGIEFDDAVAGGGDDRLDRGWRQRGAAEAGMQHDAGGVVDPLVARLLALQATFAQARQRQLACGQGAGTQAFAQLCQPFASGGQQQPPRQVGEFFGTQQRIDRWQLAQNGRRIGVGGGHRAGKRYHTAPRMPDAHQKPEEADPREGALARTLGLPPLAVRVLLARGFDTPERAREFLRPDLRSLADPFLFRDMDKAVQRVRRALQRGESILIHGDYDVDGISGTVLLHKFFSLLHASSKPYIPARADGYSISKASVAAIRQGGHGLVISVDNGTNAIDAIAELQQAGIDVIVTDHHGTTENVAQAYAVLNPRLPDAGYPDRNLAGCGVAFRLAVAVASSLSGSMLQSAEFRDFLADAMTYVALGTVADVAPLCGENRTMVFHGLRALAQSRNPGVRALLDSAGVAHRGIEVEDIAFRLAPLLNAAGRVGHALEAVQLLCAPGFREAQAAAKVLEQHNEERRRVERVLQEEVMALAAKETGPAIVLGHEDWHPGVLGIVAARVAETFAKPALLVSFQGSTGRGSGRCTTGLHLRAALGACSEFLVAHGGHAAAAGIEVRRDRFAEFVLRFQQVCAEAPPVDADLMVDGPANFADFDPQTIRRLDMLGPFGSGHQRPRFRCQGVTSVGTPLADARGSVLRLRLVQDGNLLPARLLRGGARFEELRRERGPWSLVCTPRLSRHSEEGPVVLDLHELRAERPASALG